MNADSFLRCYALRFGLGLVAVVLMLLTVCCPVQESRNKALYASSGEPILLQAGQVLEVPFRLPGKTEKLSLVTSQVKNAKELTLTVTVMQKDAEKAAVTLPLSKARVKGWQNMPLHSALPAGEYTLRVAASGTGDVALGAENLEAGAVLEGETLGAVPALMAKVNSSRYGLLPAFAGVMLLIIACMPAGRFPKKEETV